MTFGELLRSARTEQKLTQRQLADAVGVKHNSVSNWEKDVNRPDPDTIESICSALGVSGSYFFPASSSMDYSPLEQRMIKKYRTLDEYGKRAVDAVLDIEHERSATFQLVARGCGKAQTFTSDITKQELGDGAITEDL